ncbi:MAG: hypothetical protein ACJ8M4_12415 [Chthoniobacterales bacterium]
MALGSALFLVADAPGVAGPVEQSISTTRQFIVYGTRVPVRGAICELAERTKRELLALLNASDNWTTPIVINAQFVQANLPEAPRLAVNVGQTGFGLKLQLDVVIDPKISAPEVRREILRALIIEMMYRGQSNLAAGTAYISPPDWLLEGVPAAQSNLSRERVASLLALPVAAGTVLPLEQFLRQRRNLLDDPGRLLYGAYSVALVDWLARTAEGQRRLARFIAALPSGSTDLLDELEKQFSEILESRNAEKMWQQQIARASARQPYGLLSNAETERALKDKLRIGIGDGTKSKTYRLEEFPDFVKQPAARVALTFLAQELRALGLEANPVFAPIIAEYAQVSAVLARGKTGGMAKRLDRLGQARQALTLKMRKIDDYLNWFEATGVSGPSGAFSGYLKAADAAARPEHARHDPISVYLDAIETQVQN